MAQEPYPELSYVPSVHEQKIVAFFGADHVDCTAATPESMARKLIICFTNRCGSNFLAATLASSGRIPMAGESFNYPFVINYCRSHGIAHFSDFLNRIQLELSRENVFCAKAGLGQLFFLWRVGAFQTVLRDATFIHITRQDVLGQAISFSIAAQTKQWTSQHEVSQTNVTFDAADIRSRMLGITAENMRFTRFFALMGVQPICLGYEDLQADPQLASKKVGQGMGLGELSIKQSSIKLQPQRNETNERFRQRFLEEAPKNVTVQRPQAAIGERHIPRGLKSWLGNQP